METQKHCPFEHCSFPECYDEFVGKYCECPDETRIGVTIPCTVKHVFMDRIERIDSGIYVLEKKRVKPSHIEIRSTNIIVVADFSKEDPYTVYQIVSNFKALQYVPNDTKNSFSTTIRKLDMNEFLNEYGDYTVKNAAVSVTNRAMIGDRIGGEW